MIRIPIIVLAICAATPALAEWRYGNVSDPFTDEVTTGALTTAIKHDGGTAPPSLLFQCSKGKITAVVLYAAPVTQYDAANVTIRFDRDAPLDQSWPAKKNYITAPNADAFRNAVMHAKQLALRVSNGEEAVTAIFDVSLPGEAIYRVMSACGK